ncbi:MAG TPA: YcxB family protein [Chryseolinea sp.]
MNLTPTARKVIGLSVLIIFGLVELLLLAVLIYHLFTDPSLAFSFVFAIAIFGFPLWWGWKMWRSGAKKVTPVSQDTLDNSTPIILETKVTLSDYRKLMYLNTYTHPIFLFVHLIGIMFIAFYFMSDGDIWIPLFAVLFLSYLPIAVSRNAKKVYNSTKTLHEQITYTFTPESIEAKGETSDFTIKWQSMHKVKETKNWFLLYTNVQSALVVPKKSFHSDAEIEKFRLMSSVIA